MPARPKTLDIALEHRVKTIKIESGNLWMFRAMENHRPLDASRVAGLHGLLIDGRHFETPMAVNDLSQGGKSRFRIIDGGHRMAAIERFIKAHPGARVDVDFYIYDHLTEEQERVMFAAWNSGRRQSLSDWIQVNQDAIPIFRKMKESFPVRVQIYSVNSKENGIRFANLMRAYLARLNVYAAGGSTPVLMREIQALNDDDYRSVKDFMDAFIEGFGTPGNANNFSRRVPLYAITKTWFCNMRQHSRSDVVKAWKRVAKDRYCIEAAKTADSGVLSRLTAMFIETMNGSRRSDFFVTPSLKVREDGDKDGTKLKDIRIGPMVSVSK